MNSESALKARRGCSPFSPRELEDFRELLMVHQQEVLKSLGILSEASLHTPGEATGGTSSVPGHIAELASETFEQELSLDFMAREQQKLRDIHAAFERVANRSYGLCNQCGTGIPKARLEAIPTAECCLDCKSRQEQEEG